MTPHPELHRFLNAIRRRWFVTVALQICARVFVIAAAVMAAAALADRWLLPQDGAALLLSVAVLVLIAVAASLVIWPFRRRPDDARVARFIEERCPELDDTIVSAVDVSRRGPGADTFAALVIDGAMARLRALDLAHVFEPRRVRRLAVHAAAAAAALVLAVVLAAPLLQRAFEVARLRYVPGSIAVTVHPGNVRVPAGRPLTIAATLQARAGSLTRVAPTLTLLVNGQARSVPMTQANDRYEVTINAVDRSFTYRVHAGAAASPDYAVTALFPPRVRRIDLRYDFPSFTGLRAREDQDGGDIYGPAGTRVRVRVHTDKPVQDGRLAMSEGTPAVPLVRVDDRTYDSTLTLSEDAAYRVALADADGLRSEGIEYFIRLMDDRPPEVHVLRPAGDTQITPLEEVTIEARADDDYGIASFDMVYAVAGGRERTVPFTTIGGTDVSRIGSRMVAAEDLGVKPGDVITYYARARDVARGKRSTLARSEIFFLEVKPFNEEYVAAESQAMAGATGTQLESLVAAQKEIISATWNLERRSGAGRSTADIKAIADAQTELRARVQQAAGALRPRRRGFPRQIATPQPFVPGASDPVAEAVTAMTRAIGQLESRKTAEAIPHEMAALNALLKAQAEIRRRQVMQQQANGANSGGYGRQGQDLSNLFDRELKRQQRTNYETQSQIEQQPDAQKNDESALDRIRDLARRQEELGRQQRELANAGLTAEELKRQLEKLTREQEQLRQLAENLARQMAQQSGQQQQGQQQSGQPQSGQHQPAQQPGQQSSGRQQPGQQAQNGGSSSLRDAVEQMRDAASQLARQDPASAADRSEQAARQLRNLESRMQAGSPDARRRALGDLQLEAQQIAEAQRRIAREADRLDREGDGAGDARRRLAGDKEQLAERVDALQQSARRLGTDPKSPSTDRAAVTEAARDLETQRLGERMRTGARAMRDQPSKGSAGAEQQIADALDRLARRLNGVDAGGAKGDTQRLADQLDQVRDARERLARLEQQVRQAQRDQTAAQGQGGSDGRASQPAADGGRGGAPTDVQRLQEEYAREAQRTREMVDRLERGAQESSTGGSTPEEHEWSRSAPGTEAWKQDYAGWDALRKDVTRALEHYEAGVADKLSRALTADRLRAGGSDRMPDEYQQRIARYFEALAKKKPGQQ